MKETWQLWFRKINWKCLKLMVFTHDRTAGTFQNLMLLEISPCSDPVVTMGEWNG
jgi:hypothetical protein